MIIIVLFGIIGELGAGKTLGLAFLSWVNWADKKKIIYSNLDFYGFPYVKVDSIPSVEKMKGGFFAGDELWLWLDSHTSRDAKTKLISNILLKSRKRDLTICYTTQGIMQIVKRVRDITDFIALPILAPDEKTCRIVIFRGSNPTPASIIKPDKYFNTEPIFAIYNTRQEIEPLKQKDEFKEKFNDIVDNPSWILYLKKYKKMQNENHIKRYSEHIQKIINPKGIKTEKERDDIRDDFVTPI